MPHDSHALNGEDVMSVDFIDLTGSSKLQLVSHVLVLLQLKRTVCNFRLSK